VFVHLHIAIGPVILLDMLVLHLTNAKQSKLAQGVTTTQTVAEEVVGVAEQEPLVVAAWQGLGDFTLHRRGEDFIGIQEEHPFGARGVLPQVPVALFGKVAVPLEIDHIGGKMAGHVDSGIRAAGINHNHAACKITADGLQAHTEVALLVANGDGDGEVSQSENNQTKAKETGGLRRKFLFSSSN